MICCHAAPFRPVSSGTLPARASGNPSPSFGQKLRGSRPRVVVSRGFCCVCVLLCVCACDCFVYHDGEGSARRSVKGVERQRKVGEKALNGAHSSQKKPETNGDIPTLFRM